jgi:hygromycin-B 7''-O-kinase
MLPQPKTETDFNALNRADPAFADAVRNMFGAHAGTLPIKSTAVGSYPVFQVGDRYIAKLFASMHREAFETEHAVLRLLDGHAQIATPKLLEVGEVDGWSAVLMTRLSGQPLKALWPALDDDEKARVCRALGAITRALHMVDYQPASLSFDWETFLADQLEHCAERQVKRGLDQKLANQIPAFLESVDLDTPGRALLHTEIMLEHVFVEPSDSGHQITGLIDFEPAMVGVPEYEMASVGLFIAQGRPELFGAFLAGYGQRIDANFHRRIMGYALVHRYSNLSWYLQFMPHGGSVEALAEKWFLP